MSTVISVEHVSKSYRLGMIGGATLKEDFARWSAKWRGKPDPLLKIGQEDHQRRMGEQFWALDDVSFQVEEGEVLGIIGRNGAGKSTLLKIMSQVTAPTSGEIKIKGRVASLLEVGTGFHQELTGRENIFLNGAIMGMTKSEIRRKLDEIIAFSEIEEFIDTPVKRYSSGMYVRLAFAVAAHLEPEILIVDEVLAVGDAAFQKKCLGKMNDVSKQGRTVLFVSHNMGAISTLTRRCLLLNSGRTEMDGPVAEGVTAYLNSSYEDLAVWEASEDTNRPMQILRIQVSSEDNAGGGNEFDVCKEIRIDVEYVVRKLVANAVVAVNIHAADGAHVVSLEDIDQNRDLLLGRQPGRYRTRVKLPGNWLNRGTYMLRVGAGVVRGDDFGTVERISFELVETGDSLTRGHRRGYLLPMLKWEQSQLPQASL
jgi:lipopolysaccharide transport system ATP-binding protein